ncbi:hypothetical protein [Georgenia faecalis]|uniref:DUF4129 domain-containing protein n=1 Tax=Georgenia faecalis TaxID=2483799 RepID=A0ABV9DAK6_9MICO|nr:hypothetical protein [Georgenia faecalis]
MSRLTLGNAVKVGLVVVFLPLLAYLVLFIGAVKKNVRAIVEGLVYAAGFSVAVFELGWGGPGVLLGLASMAASGVRAWHLRDLWLPARRRWWHRFVPAESPGQAALAAPSTTAALEPADARSSALAAVAHDARRNRHRLPPTAVASLLETCRTLDAVIVAEKQEPSGDARLEYELDAMVQQYLPAVVRAYLAIPPSMVDSRQPNGRTPKEELAEQLQILSAQAQSLYTSRYSRTPAQLTTTGNFLREKFGHPESAYDFGVR